MGNLLSNKPQFYFLPKSKRITNKRISLSKKTLKLTNNLSLGNLIKDKPTVT